MASILVVSDGRSAVEEAATLLRTMGHRVLLCGGGPAPFTPCPLIKFGSCPLAEGADLIVFAFGAFPPAARRVYGGAHLLSAYRNHPDFGNVPMVVAVDIRPDDIGGDGPAEILGGEPDIVAIAAAADRLLSTRVDRPIGPTKKGRMALVRQRRRGQALLRR